jgi:hypothetical protein
VQKVTVLGDAIPIKYRMTKKVTVKVGKGNYLIFREQFFHLNFDIYGSVKNLLVFSFVEHSLP